YTYIIEQDRIVVCYKLNLDAAEKAVLLKKVYSAENKNYNFFTSNCASVIFSTLYDVKNETGRTSFVPPVVILRDLIKKGFVEYEGAFIRTVRNKKHTVNYTSQKKYDLSQSMFYTIFSTQLSENGVESEFSLFSFNRPFEGYSVQRNNVVIGDFQMLYDDNKIKKMRIIPTAIELRPRFLNSLFGGIYDCSFFIDSYNCNNECKYDFIQKAGLYLSVRNLTLKSFIENYSKEKFNSKPVFEFIFSTHSFDLYNLWSYKDDKIEYDSTRVAVNIYNRFQIFGVIKTSEVSGGITISF
nr:DUF4105 domain-containing protein [Treponema sp.]